MAIQPAGSYATHLLSYAIASADMYYTEMERCDVFLNCNERGNLHIWGQTAYGEPPIPKDLFEMFLEYALYCESLPDREEMRSTMKNFGEHLGRSLANHIQKDISPSRSCTSVCQILKYILETVDSHPLVESDDTEMCITVADYPLEKVAKQSGLWNMELAHYGINSMCQCLIHCINPYLSVNASSDIHSEFVFTITFNLAGQTMHTIGR